MKNTYLTSHFPLISIVLFSLSFSIYTESFLVQYLTDIGLYSGMIEFFSERGIKLTLLFLLWLFFFMLFSALKLIADTINELTLLFFSKDEDGKELRGLRSGSWIFLIAGIVSLALFFSIKLLLILVVITCFIYFIFFVYKISSSMSPLSVVGVIVFQIFFWFSFAFAVLYALLKIYNSVIASLPV